MLDGAEAEAKAEDGSAWPGLAWPTLTFPALPSPALFISAFDSLGGQNHAPPRPDCSSERPRCLQR